MFKLNSSGNIIQKDWGLVTIAPDRKGMGVKTIFSRKDARIAEEKAKIMKRIHRLRTYGTTLILADYTDFSERKFIYHLNLK